MKYDFVYLKFVTVIVHFKQFIRKLSCRIKIRALRLHQKGMALLSWKCLNSSYCISSAYAIINTFKISKLVKMNFGGSLQNEMLKAYIDKIFEKYDTDNSGTLDEQEMTYFFNDLFKTLGMNTTVTKEQSIEAIRSIDKNFDGQIDKKELFDAFKIMMTQNNPPPPPPQFGPYHQYNHYNPMGGSTGYKNPYSDPYQNSYGQSNPYQYNPYSYNPYSYNPYNQGPYNPYNQYQPQNNNPYNPYTQSGMNSSNSNYGGGWGRNSK